LNQEINNTKTRYDDLVIERTKCFSGVFRHFASLMCLSCETNYLNNGIYLDNNKNIHLNLSFGTCSKVQDDCIGYLQKLVEMNKNAIFFANTDSIDSLNLTNDSTNSYSSANDLYTFLNNRINSLRNMLNQQILFIMPNNCSEVNCSWICLNYLTATGLNFEQILNGTMLSADALSQNLNFGGTRILQNLTVNSSMINFSDSFNTNTYTKADSTNINFTIDGGAGLQLFEDTTTSTLHNSNYFKKLEFHEVFLWFISLILIIFD